MNTLHMLLRAVGTCVLILAGSVLANWVAWVLIVGVMLPFTIWKIVKRRTSWSMKSFVGWFRR